MTIEKLTDEDRETLVRCASNVGTAMRVLERIDALTTENERLRADRDAAYKETHAECDYLLRATEARLTEATAEIERLRAESEDVWARYRMAIDAWVRWDDLARVLANQPPAPARTEACPRCDRAECFDPDSIGCFQAREESAELERRRLK